MAETRREDRRAARSRRAILGAFERLLTERPLADISVSAVAREADVDRKTIYQHFGGIEGIFSERVRLAVDRVLDSVESACQERGEKISRIEDESALRAFFSALAVSLSENVELDRNVLGSMAAEELLERLATPLAHGLSERGLVPDSLDERALEYCLAFEVGGLIALYRTWALSGPDASLKDATLVAQRLVGSGIQGMSLMARPGASAR